MSNPKRHHYLPQFYLDGFCHEGGLWVFDKETRESRFQTPVNTGVKQYYYRFEYEDGEQSFEVEEFLSQVETRTAPVIDKLRRQEDIDGEERGHLAFFLGTLLGRTPSAEKKHDKLIDALIRDRYKKRFPTPDSLGQYLQENAEIAKSVGSDVNLDALWGFIHGGAYHIDVHRNESIKAMLLLANDVAPAYFEMDWHVLRPTKTRKSFITGDTPVVHSFQEPPAFTEFEPCSLPRGVQVIAPLAHDCLLVIQNDKGEPGFGTLSDDWVRRFNLTIAVAAERFVIGRDKALVESIAAAAKPELLVSRDFEEALEVALASRELEGD
jgi:hypothetical protein